MHNVRDGVSNHRCLDSLLHHLFKRRSKKTSKLRVTAFCNGNPPVTGEFPAQRASNAGLFPFDDVIMESEILKMLFFLFLGLQECRRNRLIQWLLIFWHLMSSGLRQPRFWLRMIWAASVNSMLRDDRNRRYVLVLNQLTSLRQGLIF